MSEMVNDARLDEAFHRLNQQHFEGRLPPAKFMSVNLGGKFALYFPKPAGIIGFHPRVLQQSAEWIEDSMLHEMVHMSLDDGSGVDKEHGARFVAEANRIAQTLGLRPVEPASDEAVDWPQSVREPGYATWT